MDARTTVSIQRLPEGVRSFHVTLDRMREYVRAATTDLGLRDFATHVLAAGGVTGHDFDGEVQALFAYVRDRITYRRDPVAVEMVCDARRTLERGAGDCDDKVVLLCSLLAVTGHTSRFVCGGDEPDDFLHVWCEAETKGGWVALDPTKEDAPPGWQHPFRFVMRREIF